MSAPSEDHRRRADRNGRYWHRCARCDRWFLHSSRVGSVAGPNVTVCGVLLRPPEPHCLLEDDFGKRWWPKGKPLPDLVAIQRLQDEALLAAD